MRPFCCISQRIKKGRALVPRIAHTDQELVMVFAAPGAAGGVVKRIRVGSTQVGRNVVQRGSSSRTGVRKGRLLVSGLPSPSSCPSVYAVIPVVAVSSATSSSPVSVRPVSATCRTGHYEHHYHYHSHYSSCRPTPSTLDEGSNVTRAIYRSSIQINRNSILAVARDSGNSFFIADPSLSSPLQQPFSTLTSTSNSTSLPPPPPPPQHSRFYYSTTTRTSNLYTRQPLTTPITTTISQHTVRPLSSSYAPSFSKHYLRYHTSSTCIKVPISYLSSITSQRVNPAMSSQQTQNEASQGGILETVTNALKAVGIVGDNNNSNNSSEGFKDPKPAEPVQDTEPVVKADTTEVKKAMAPPPEIRLDEKFVGSIDQGTTSSRFIIFNDSGMPVSSHQIEFENIYPQSG